MQCVRDGTPCVPLELEGVHVDVCSTCHGVWLDDGELKSLTSHFSVIDEEAAETVLERWLKLKDNGHTAPADFWSETSYTCPKDGATLQKHYFAGSQIGVDMCPLCRSFWIDGAELAAIVKYVGPDPLIDNAGRYMVKETNHWYGPARAGSKEYDLAIALGTLMITPTPAAAASVLFLVGQGVLGNIKDELISIIPVA